MQYQKEDVRKRIIDAAREEFLRVGYFRASMLQISNRAKVPIGNLYRYFSSKATLFDAIVGTAKDRIVEIIQGAQELFSETGYQGGIIGAISDHLMELAKGYRKEMTILLEKSAGSSYENFLGEVIDLVRNILTNKVKSMSENQNEFLVELISDNVMRGIFRIMMERPLEEQREELVGLLTFYFKDVGERF